MAGVTGNFAGLLRLIGDVNAVTTPAWRAQLCQGLGTAALKQLMDEFRESRDPYGVPWQPLKIRKGKPLLDTGRMRASVSLVAQPGGFEITIGVAYAATHQYGAKNIRPRRARMLSWKTGGKRYFAKSVTVPQRMMIPPSDNPGPLWSAALYTEADLRVRAHFEGRGP
jgi:phage gpG-like protein